MPTIKQRMSTVEVRFYASLNQLVSNNPAQRARTYRLRGPVSVKHVIESFGVPHTEVALVLANGTAVTFSTLAGDGDRLAVYPHFSILDISELRALRPPLPQPPRFVLDVHLGKLARYLRLLGFNAHYRNDYDDAELALISAEQKRILLTRDRRLLMRKGVDFGHCLLSREPQRQLLAILHRYQLGDELSPWRRCLRCNGELQPVAKKHILHRLKPLTIRYYDDFHICGTCDHIYWKGSHYGPLQTFVEHVRQYSIAPQIPYSPTL